MAVIDFGKLQLKNNVENNERPAKPELIAKESEEDGKSVSQVSYLLVAFVFRE